MKAGTPTPPGGPAPDPGTLAALLARAGDELSQQPAPAMARAIFDALPLAAGAHAQPWPADVGRLHAPTRHAVRPRGWRQRLLHALAWLGLPHARPAPGDGGLPAMAQPAETAARRRQTWRTVAAACSLMLVSVTVLLLAAPAGGPLGTPRLATAAGGGAGAGGAGASFVPVAPQERWLRLRDDGDAAWVVTTELPQARLASYGLPFDPAHAADTVRAELLMRASGEVLAVRVLQ